MDGRGSFASSEETRRRMQAVRRRDTPAEVAIRSLLHREGFRYRVDRAPIASIRRRADIVFAATRVAVFIDGCFWHGCPLHATWPKANAGWWRSKIQTTRQRDEETTKKLAEAGWAVLRVWTHERSEEVVERIASLVRARRAVRANTRGESQSVPSGIS